MPIPTCAAVIIFTSFAPSPIARVFLFGLFLLIIVTISAFCFGLTLQAITTFADWESSKNSALTLGLLVILINESPATITALSRASSVCFCSALDWVICSMTALVDLASIIKVSMSTLRRLQEMPMFIAVSILSPVSTQTFIPADLMNSSVPDTSSCSLSSIAVEPTRLKPTSI